MKSVAQEYVEQGVAQGLAQGVVKGVRQVARNMLFELHLDLETVKRATKLSQKDLNQIIQERIIRLLLYPWGYRQFLLILRQQIEVIAEVYY